MRKKAIAPFLTMLLLLVSAGLAGPVSAEPTTCGTKTHIVGYNYFQAPAVYKGGGKLKFVVAYCSNGRTAWANGSGQPTTSIITFSGIAKPVLVSKSAVWDSGYQALLVKAKWKLPYVCQIPPFNNADMFIFQETRIDRYGDVTINIRDSSGNNENCMWANTYWP